MTTMLPPVRNRYFYGKLLDADHLQLEQRYFLEQARQINRLTLGVGVLCGLHVDWKDGKVVVSPGVAVDGLGREIVVDRPVTIDPWSLGENGDRPTADQIVLLLCYHECESEPAPVLVADCELREECVPSVVRERFLLRAVDADTWTPSGQITEEQCRAIFGEAPSTDVPGSETHGELAAIVGRSLRRMTYGFAGSPDDALRARLCELLSGSCESSPECVPIAFVTRDGTVDNCATRTTIYSNTVLLDLILCLAERVEKCCGRRVRLDAPVITETYPAPAEMVPKAAYDDALEGAAFSLTFDHEMDANRLAKPEEWMRMLLIPVGATVSAEHHAEAAPTATGVSGALLVPVELVRTEDAGGTAKRAVYGYTDAAKERVDSIVEELKPSSLMFVVVVRSDDLTQIADTADPPELLDADFAGTALPTPATRELLWWLDATKPLPLPGTYLTTSAIALPQGTPLPSLPTGNGIEGGVFHAWFAVNLSD
jgi:hypothetical protein